MKATFFRTPAELRKWFARHHAAAAELLVGFYKKETGRTSVTWPESVDEALCFGWIDGIRRRRDDDSYTIRFTPRRPGSIWSAVNIRKARALIAARRMGPAGRKAFAARKENRSGIYSYEQRPERLGEPYEKVLREEEAAWTFFQGRPASYRRAVCWWVISARREETRHKRVRTLAAHSARREMIPQFTRRVAGAGVAKHGKRG